MANPIATLIVRITSDTSKFVGGLAAAEGKLAATSGKMVALGGKLTKGLTLPLMAIGGLAVAGAMEVGKGMRIISQKTGETGLALDNLGKSYRTALGKVPQGAGTVADVISMLKIRTGETGTALSGMAEKILNLSRITGTDATQNVDLITKAFTNWGVASGDQAKSLDFLYGVVTKTGVSLNTVTDGMTKAGPVLRGFGFSFEQSASMVGLLEKAGINTNQVMMGLKTGLGKFAKAGKDPVNTFRDITTQIKNAGSASEATGIAVNAFGARAGPALAEAIRSGRFEVDALVAALEKSPASIDKMAEKTLTLKDKFNLMKNQLAIAVEPLGKSLIDAFKSAMPYITKGIGAIKGIVDVFTKLPGPVKAGLLALGGLALVAGPMMSVGGRVVRMVSGIGTAIGGIGKGIAGGIGFLGKFSKGMSGISNAAGGLTTPLLSAGGATADIGTKAAGAAGGLGSMMGVALPLAGAVVGVGLAVGACVLADRKAEKARTDGIVAASNMTQSLDELRSKTANLTVGTQEYNTAMAELAARATEIVAKTGGVGAIFDDQGNIIDADTGFINLMADGYRTGTKAQIELAQATAKGTQTLQQGITVHGQYGKSVDTAKTALDDFKQKMYEKMEAGQKMSAMDQIVLMGLTNDWQNAAKGQGSAIDSMQKSVDAFSEKLQGPGGLSAVTKKDLGSMITAMANASPKVRAKGMAMFQQIINAEAAKNPAIQANMQSILDNVARRIEETPAGERTAAVMQQIVNEEVNKYGPITDEMATIMGGVESIVGGTDLSGEGAAMMASLARGITSAGWNVISAAQIVANKVKELFPGEGGGGGAGEQHMGGSASGVRFHSGGGPYGMNLSSHEIPTVLLDDEYVLRGSAARKFGSRTLDQLNKGRLPSSGSVITVGDVHLHSVSPEYDVQQFHKLLNDVAKRGAHSGRMMPRTV